MTYMLNNKTVSAIVTMNLFLAKTKKIEIYPNKIVNQNLLVD